MPDAPTAQPRPLRPVVAEEGQARRRRLRRALQRAARAPERARRAGRSPARHRRDQNPRHGLRRRRQALAPEGHRPCPRRLEPLADLDRRRHRLRPPAALLHLQGQPQGAARRAAQRALAARRARLDRRSSTRRPSTAPKTSQALELLDDWDQPRPDARGARAPRSPPRRSRSATSRAWRSSPHESVGVADIARRRLARALRRPALDGARPRAPPAGRPRGRGEEA